MIVLSEYVVFDMEYLIDLYNMVRSSTGTIVTIAVYTLLIVLGVYTALDVIRRFI